MPRDFHFSPPASGPTPSMDDAAVSQAASEWVVRCDRGMTQAEQKAFAAWRSADPRHAAEFGRVKQTWQKFDELGAVAELEAMANDITARARARRSFQRARWSWSAWGAAVAVIAIGVFTWRQRESESEVLLQTENQSYRVLASTLQRIALPDGSVAELNGASRIEIDFSATERRVRLLDGEAHFVVQPDSSRPFFVSAGAVTVRAVGTAFNVRLAPESVEILVTEGKVKLETDENAGAVVDSASVVPGSVSTTTAPNSAMESAVPERSPALVKGQRAVIPRVASARRLDHAKVAIGDVGQAEMDDALGWQSTRLVFNNTPLHEVVAGFNRHNDHRITIAHPAIRNRTLTGVFRADNLEGFLRLLQHTIDVKAEPRTSTETALLPTR